MSVDPSPAVDAGHWDEGAWAAWAVGLVEPLIDPADRLATVAEMHRQARSHRLRAVTLLSGTLCDLMDSLPDGDPWRRVNPTTFGTWRDGTDLVPVENLDLREDIGLAALAKPLDTDAVHLMSTARHGWEAVTREADHVEDPVRSLTRTIAWLTWRRRAYLGEDNYPVLAVFFWLRQAALLASGKEIDESTHAEQRISAKIHEDI